MAVAVGAVGAAEEPRARRVEAVDGAAVTPGGRAVILVPENMVSMVEVEVLVARAGGRGGLASRGKEEKEEEDKRKKRKGGGGGGGERRGCRPKTSGRNAAQFQVEERQRSQAD